MFNAGAFNVNPLQVITTFLPHKVHKTLFDRFSMWKGRGIIRALPLDTLTGTLVVNVVA